MRIAELIIKGRVYRVDIPTYDIFKLLSVNNPQYIIELTKRLNPYDDYYISPMITCLLDIKYNNIKLIIPTPSVLSQYYQYSKFIPLCFGYDEFIFTKKSDWYGYNVYPNIYESIYKQGELLSKVALIMSFIDKERKDINIFFGTKVDNNVIYNTVLFRQITPNMSVDEINREYTQGKFVNFKKKFIYGFKKVDWKSRLMLKDTQTAGTYVKKIANNNSVGTNNNSDFDNYSD
ncbi:hypothetical protein FG379_002866 [Cryptosporidium bovis]|uniref:uncharacterized protein n=1 Tax=Cryptosporidium bovis TaxID=310047 RepID=UPI003519F830|nr:hypothetical protein FG379_002866 [Cryptosporidium bovis]